MQHMNMVKSKRVCTLLLRVLALCATIAAAIVMGTSREKSSFFTIQFEAKYNHTPAFMYFLIVNVIGGVYSLLVLFSQQRACSGDSSLPWMCDPKITLLALKKKGFLPEQCYIPEKPVIAVFWVITMLLTSGVSAALAIAYVGKKGNSYAGWLPICGQVEGYCHQVGGALATGFAGVIIYMLILLYSLHSATHPLHL